ncbi:MAG TPA: hypothetical protein VFB77_10635, partial [Acidimicrobiales bacterium]|nr:hypothetical protein [Acidimicrobiales bacterium]
DRRPGVAAVAGALTIAFSAILVKLADVEPSTAAIFRCAYALPVLWVFAAWALLSERIERRILVALPLVCTGVVLISGALESGAYGEHPARGVLFGFLTGVTYAGFILVLRQGSGDLRRPAGPLFDATAVAAVVAVVAADVPGHLGLLTAIAAGTAAALVIREDRP